MIDKDDWRLQGQERYLLGKTLSLKNLMELKNGTMNIAILYKKIMDSDSPYVESTSPRLN